jgi:hypothetical protein
MCVEYMNYAVSGTFVTVASDTTGEVKNPSRFERKSATFQTKKSISLAVSVALVTIVAIVEITYAYG